jgi:hypothetical protein
MKMLLLVLIKDLWQNTKNIRGKITLLLSAFIGISFPDMLHPVFSVFVFSFIFQSAFLEFLWFFLYAIEKYL